MIPRVQVVTGAGLVLALWASTGCFATRDDVRLLQNDLLAMRTQSQQADSLRRLQLDRVISELQVANDSLRSVSSRTQKGFGDVRSDLYAMGQQLIQIQELTGQSQSRLEKLRGQLEANHQSTAPIAAAPTPATPDTSHGAAATQAPGPNELFELALDQLRRGSTGAARAGFQDLLQKYPNSDIAPDAQFYLADAYSREGNTAAADSGYQLVVSRYPNSPRAPTALFKHATIERDSGKMQAAKASFEEVVQKYPQSDEAVLAKDRLRDLAAR